MNIHISNLNTAVTNKELTDLFSGHGQVKSAEVSMDAFTNQSRGFGLVEMEDDGAAQKAIDALNNSEFKSQVISVKIFEPAPLRKGSYKVGSGAVDAYRFRKN